MLIKKPYLMIFWFLPMFNSMKTVSYAEIGITDYIKYVQLGLALSGLFYLLLKSTSVRLSLGVLFILLLLAFNMLYSDIREYQLVAFLMGYGLMVHIIAKKYPYEIWSQYYFICLVISWFSIIDLISFFILGDFIISYRTPEVMGNGLPRINTIFDEMSHQAFFMMPAVVFSLVNNSKMRYLLLVGLVSTMSVAALLLFTAALLVYLRKRLLHNLISVVPLIIIISLALFLGSEYIISKISGIFVTDALITGEQKKSVSAASILLCFEILRNISLEDLFLGYGFFGLAENVPKLLYNSDLYSYFEMRGSFDDPKSIGIFNLVLYFGLLQCGLIAVVLLKVKKYVNDAWLYKLVIFAALLSLLYNSHTVEYLIHLFFVFGLSWGCTQSPSEKVFDRKAEIVSNKILNQ
tara:strand:- start:3089 stop:4309 length:1221 start_codon:yes stop_codon:yes gene_type:complete